MSRNKTFSFRVSFLQSCQCLNCDDTIVSLMVAERVDGHLGLPASPQADGLLISFLSQWQQRQAAVQTQLEIRPPQAEQKGKHTWGEGRAEETEEPVAGRSPYPESPVGLWWHEQTRHLPLPVSLKCLSNNLDCDVTLGLCFHLMHLKVRLLRKSRRVIWVPKRRLLGLEITQIYTTQNLLKDASYI